MGKYDSTYHMYLFLNILNLKSIRTYFVILLIYRNINLYSGSKIFKFIETTHNTRSNNINLFCLPLCTTSFNDSVLFDGPKLWNSLIAEIKIRINITTYLNSKRKLKSIYLHPKIHEKEPCHLNKTEHKLYSYCISVCMYICLA